jgi:hypothetical protein
VLAPPASVALTASQDTTVRILFPNQNFGDDTSLDINRALVQFDSAALKAAVGPQDLVMAAKLELTLTSNRLRTFSRQVGAFRLTTGWTELGATWNCPTDTNLNNDRPDCVTDWSMGLRLDSIPCGRFLP